MKFQNVEGGREDTKLVEGNNPEVVPGAAAAAAAAAAVAAAAAAGTRV